MTNRRIMEIADMLEGEINRMCVTQDTKELKSMMKYAWNNIFKIYELRLAELRGEENENV